MSKTRDNHFVPQWYQRGFFEPGEDEYAYLDLQPKVHFRGDGSPVPGRTQWSSPTARCFNHYDLYTTFFGFDISDEIERRLFGAIDGKGSLAVAAFADGTVEDRIRHFENFFEYLDAQKLRTPKGLAWLRRHYPFLDQNQLMFEMQGVRRLHCSLWAQCVREIVSAEDSKIKFLISDHPVTIYNHAVPPGDPVCAYPNDPSIAWKASQTLFPLNRDFCLILTNLEYAQDPALADPRRKRINAKNFGDALVRTDTMIRSRRLKADEVVRINHVIKARATRHVAAGQRDWLFPEQHVDTDWAGIRTTLLPPEDELWGWGGETYIGFKDGSSAYQDAYGRSEPAHERLLKDDRDHPRGPKDPCGCGSGQAYRACCATRPAELRPSWSELSIRERNLIHIRAAADILGLEAGKDWTEVRRDLTNDKIAEIYTIFRVLWPPETDIFALLPKPDGRLRALFTGIVDPRMLVEFAVGAADYFGEILIQNPFQNGAALRPEFDPTKVPGEFRFELIKNVLMLLELAPLIDAGLVNFFPDPCDFDRNLRQQMTAMAEARNKGSFDGAAIDPRTRWLMVDDRFRHLWGATEEAIRADILLADPDATEKMIVAMIAMVQEGRAHDPLAALAGNVADDGTPAPFACVYNMVPNYELTLLIAQATGSIIVTDSPYRWREIQTHPWYAPGGPVPALPALRAAIEGADHGFLYAPQAVADVLRSPGAGGYRALIDDAMRYLAAVDRTGVKPNWESQLPRRFEREHAILQAAMRKTGAPGHIAKAKCIIPAKGIRDNMVNRLIVTSSVEHYLECVPMAFFFERPDPSTYVRMFPSKPWASGPEPELLR